MCNIGTWESVNKAYQAKKFHYEWRLHLYNILLNASIWDDSYIPESEWQMQIPTTNTETWYTVLSLINPRRGNTSNNAGHLYWTIWWLCNSTFTHYEWNGRKTKNPKCVSTTQWFCNTERACKAHNYWTVMWVSSNSLSCMRNT